jgi:hypothetical protein
MAGSVAAGDDRLPMTLPACLLAALLALPDILPPGHQGVQHRLVVTAGGIPEGMRLVAAPVRGLNGVHEVVPGEPFVFSQKYGTRLYLVPAGAPVAEFDHDAFARHAHSDTFPQVASVPFASPLRQIVTSWRITGVTGTAIAVERVGEVRLDATGNPLPAGAGWIPIALIGAIGAGWLVVLGRRRVVAAQA